MELPDLAEITDLLELLPAGVDQTRAKAKLKQASARFRGAVRHPVSHIEDDEVTLDGDGTRALLLPAAPVTAVATVEVDGDEVDVDWSEAGVLRRRHGRWPDRPRVVRVVYSHGYEVIPDEIQEAVLGMAQYLMAVTPGVSSMQVGGQTISTSAANAEETVTGPWAAVVAAYQLNRGDSA